MKSEIIGKAIGMVLFFTLLCGIIYPTVMTGASQLLFPQQASGSIIEVNGVKYGSSLLAQQFTQDKYLWCRPMNLNAGTYKDQEEAPVPTDLVTCSGSGLDPHISVTDANYQAARVAEARGIGLEEVEKIIERHTTQKFLGVLGESVVNVLEVNLALDGIIEE